MQSQQASLRQQQAQDQSDEAQQATALSGAQSTQNTMELEQAQITGQLATAVAAQAAAQDAAAAAAVAAAQKNAAQKNRSRARPAAPHIPTRRRWRWWRCSSGPAGFSLPDPALNPFLQCVVQAESGGNYQAVSPNGLYMGAFQFSQSTWNLAALAAALSILVNVPPNRATKAEQDTLAVVLYSLDGEQPWLGDRCSA